VQDTHIWQAVLGEIELTVSRGSFVTWFKNTQLLRSDESLTVIGVPNVFIKQQLERKYADTIRDVLAKNGIVSARIDFKIHSSLAANKRIDESDEVVLDRPSRPATTPAARQSGLTHAYRQGLNDKYTFETFIVGTGLPSSQSV
jgi:chromosomal replication initiator protein